jgi:two-component system, OmpR family, sensor kinase
MRMRLPIRLRLTLAFAAGMVVVLTALGAFVYLRLAHELTAQIDVALRSRAQVVEAGVRSGTFDAQSGGLIDADEAFAQVLDASGTVLESSPQVSGGPLVSASSLPETGPAFVERDVPGLEAPIRLVVTPVRGTQKIIAIGLTLSDRQEALDRLLVLFAIGGPVALLVTSLAGWVLAGAALRPVERMRREASAISASEPDRRLPVPSADDELRRLATTLNDMLARLQEAIARERRFVDDASHELRTPLGILTGELELALARPRSAAEMEGTIRRASEEADRLARLAEDLLVLARTEEGRLPIHREDVTVRDVVTQACDGRRPSAVAADISISVEIPEGRARVDPIRLRQALENLLDNAIRHSEPGGVVRVTGGRGSGRAWIRVDDDGPGFTPDVLPVAFEPFARGTANGNGTSVGAGLGLAIVRTVATAHGGDAVAENPEGGGARVTLAFRT